MGYEIADIINGVVQGGINVGAAVYDRWRSQSNMENAVGIRKQDLIRNGFNPVLSAGSSATYQQVGGSSPAPGRTGTVTALKEKQEAIKQIKASIDKLNQDKETSKSQEVLNNKMAEGQALKNAEQEILNDSAQYKVDQERIKSAVANLDYRIQSKGNLHSSTLGTLPGATASLGMSGLSLVDDWLSQLSSQVNSLISAGKKGVSNATEYLGSKVKETYDKIKKWCKDNGLSSEDSQRLIRESMSQSQIEMIERYANYY